MPPRQTGMPTAPLLLLKSAGCVLHTSNDASIHLLSTPSCAPNSRVIVCVCVPVGGAAPGGPVVCGPAAAGLVLGVGAGSGGGGAGSGVWLLVEAP